MYMKRFISRVLNTLPKRIAAVLIIATAVALPVAASAADTVTIEGAISAANATAGDTQFQSDVNASYDQVVKFQVYYHNRENADSGKVAQNVRVKIDMPTAAGATQVVKTTISGDNTNTVTDQATVHLDRADAYLDYIPGSAVWRHNTGTNDNVTYTEEKVSDAVVTDGQGLVLENEKPCYNFAASLTIQARVHIPGVKIDKQSRVKGSGQAWSTNNTAKPGDTMEYLITYQNTGNTDQNNVVIRDNLPPQATLLPGTTYLANQVNPNGVLLKRSVKRPPRHRPAMLLMSSRMAARSPLP
jgi:uncharacterized repeat protein (TIGR01451 family)